MPVDGACGQLRSSPLSQASTGFGRSLTQAPQIPLVGRDSVPASETTAGVEGIRIRAPQCFDPHGSATTRLLSNGSKEKLLGPTPLPPVPANEKSPSFGTGRSLPKRSKVTSMTVT